jgi:hypothetical protein
LRETRHKVIERFLKDLMLIFLIIFHKQEFELVIGACKANNVVVVLEIGKRNGYDTSEFSKMARTKALKERFVMTLLEIVDKFDLGGVHINWEYPVYPGASSDIPKIVIIRTILSLLICIIDYIPQNINASHLYTFKAPFKV